MNNKIKLRKLQYHSVNILQLAALIILSLFLNTANASGFQLFGENASELGNAYAGSSAIALDASTNYFNPAGLVVFNTRQVTYSTIVRFSSVKFNGQSLWQFAPNPSAPGASFLQGGNVTSNQTNVIPAFNEAIPLTDRFALGLSVVLPYQFSTDFASNSPLQYVNTHSSILVVDITPGFAVAITPQWSIGAGVDVDYADLDTDYMYGTPAPMFGLSNPASMNSKSDNSADGWGVTGHAGIIYQLSPDTRFGLSYHGPVTFNLSGDSKFSGPLAGQFANANFVSSSLRSKFKLPDYIEFSVYQRIRKKLELLGSIDYVRWSLLNNLTLRNVQLVSQTMPVTTNLNMPLHLHNAFRAAVGANYFILPNLKILTGVAYDEGAMGRNSAINFPDNNNIAVATGISYKLNKYFSFDVGYSHIFNLGTNNINFTSSSGFQQVNVFGGVKRSENLVGAQITWNIGYLGTTPRLADRDADAKNRSNRT